VTVALENKRIEYDEIWLIVGSWRSHFDENKERIATLDDNIFERLAFASDATIDIKTKIRGRTSCHAYRRDVEGIFVLVVYHKATCGRLLFGKKRIEQKSVARKRELKAFIGTDVLFDTTRKKEDDSEKKRK
jgi:hypothetical protein